jgi:hypothetical protein
MTMSAEIIAALFDAEIGDEIERLRAARNDIDRDLRTLRAERKRRRTEPPPPVDELAELSRPAELLYTLPLLRRLREVQGAAAGPAVARDRRDRSVAVHRDV